MVAARRCAVVDWRSRDHSRPKRYFSGDSCSSVSYGLVTFSMTIARASAASRTTRSWRWSATTLRLTRCTTCDTEHPYKGGKAPRLRKKKTSVEAAYDEVLESVKQDTQPHAVLVAHPDAEGSRIPIGRRRGAGPQDSPAHSDNGNTPPQTAPEEVRSASPVDSSAAAAHRARAGRAPRAGVHHQTGEQAPGAIPEQQLQTRALREKRRPGGQRARAFGRPGWPSRPRQASRARRSDASGRRTSSGTRRSAQALAIGTVHRLRFAVKRSSVCGKR